MIRRRTPTGCPRRIPDMPEFAPPDAEYFDEEPMEIDL